MSQIKKLKQPVIPVFEPNQEEWNERENDIINSKENYIKRKNELQIEDDRLPHKKSIEEIIFDVRIVFMELLNSFLKKENPMSFILSENKYQFAFCVLVIIIGIILLLFSNILK